MAVMMQLQEQGLTLESLVCGAGFPESTQDIPATEHRRGRCPRCGQVMVANLYRTPKEGYLTVNQCWGALMPTPTCQYQNID